MAEMDRPGGNKFILGLLLGSVIGAALGILLAPAKGSETRKKLRETQDALKARIKNKAKENMSEIPGLEDPEQNHPV